jgi:hypothetical protein
MSRIRQALYDKFELNWFDLAEYDIEDSTERWAAIISNRNSVKFLAHCFADISGRPILRGHASKAIEVPGGLVDTIKTRFAEELLACIGSANAGAGCGLSNNLCSSVHSLRPIDYFVPSIKLSEILKKHGLNLESRINISDVANETFSELWDAIGIETTDSFEALPPPVTFERFSASQENCVKLLELLKEDALLAPNHCSVNLNASDEVLIEHFREWLSRTRSNAGHKQTPKFSSVSYSKWKKHKILPFVDLSLWALYRNFQISNEEYGDILFPDEDVDRSEKVRKTTKKLAEEIFNPSTERAIKWQLELEKTMKPERK